MFCGQGPMTRKNRFVLFLIHKEARGIFPGFFPENTRLYLRGYSQPTVQVKMIHRRMLRGRPTLTKSLNL